MLTSFFTAQIVLTSVCFCNSNCLFVVPKSFIVLGFSCFTTHTCFATTPLFYVCSVMDALCAFMCLYRYAVHFMYVFNVCALLLLMYV